MLCMYVMCACKEYDMYVMYVRMCMVSMYVCMCVCMLRMYACMLLCAMSSYVCMYV